MTANAISFQDLLIGRRLLALSASLASLAVWIAPEIIGEGNHD